MKLCDVSTDDLLGELSDRYPAGFAAVVCSRAMPIDEEPSNELGVDIEFLYTGDIGTVNFAVDVLKRDIISIIEPLDLDDDCDDCDDTEE